MVLPLSQCCFRVPLRTGALTIAILYLVVNIVVLQGWAVLLIAEVASHLMDREHPSDSEYQTLVPATAKILGGLTVLCGINITMDSLLVHGARRNQRKFVLPWVVWYGIFTSLATLALLGVWIWLLALYAYAVNHPDDTYQDVPLLKTFVITIGCCAALAVPVMWYWYACVVSYYRVLPPYPTVSSPDSAPLTVRSGGFAPSSPDGE